MPAVGQQLSAAPQLPVQNSTLASGEAEGLPASAGDAGAVPAEELALASKGNHISQQPPLDVQPGDVVLLPSQEDSTTGEADSGPVVLSCGDQEQSAQAATACGNQVPHEGSVSGHCEAGSAPAAHPAQQLVELLDASLRLQSLATGIPAALDATTASAALIGDQPAGTSLPAANPAQQMATCQQALLYTRACHRQLEVALQARRQAQQLCGQAAHPGCSTAQQHWPKPPQICG